MLDTHSPPTAPSRSIRTYLFCLEITSLTLTPPCPQSKVIFTIGNNFDTAFIHHDDPNLQQLSLQTDMIYNNDTKTLDMLRGLLKVVAVREGKEEVAGIAELVLNDGIEDEKEPQLQERELTNLPGVRGVITFKMKGEEVFQESSPLLKRNVSEFFTEQHNQLYQISVLESSVDKPDHENLDNLGQLIDDLRRKVLTLEEKVLVMEGEKGESEKVIARFKEKESVFKKALKQLEESFQRLRQELNQKETAYQGLIESINTSANPDMKQIQSYILCKTCELLRGEIQQKEKYYEDQLSIVEGILKQRDEEIIRLHERIDTLEKRAEVLKYKHKECQLYETLIRDIFLSLRHKATEMQISIPELNLSDELLKVRENLPSIFANLLGRLQPHFGIVINGVEEAENAEKQHLWEELKKKSVIVSDLQFDLQKAYDRLNQLQVEADNYKHERESLMSSATARFGEISFGRMESLRRRDSDIHDLRMRETNKPDSEMEFLKKRNQELEELLNQQDKVIESLHRQNSMKTKELEVRIDLEKKIQNTLQNDVDVQKQLNARDSIINNLRLTIDQYEEDIAELTEKVNGEEPPKRKPKQPIQSKTGDEALESDLKNLLESLDKEDSQDSIELEQQEQPHDNFDPNRYWVDISPQIKGSLQKKIKSLSLEFLRMKSLKVSRCKSKEETEQLMKDFINFRVKLEDAMNFIDGL